MHVPYGMTTFLGIVASLQTLGFILLNDDIEVGASRTMELHFELCHHKHVSRSEDQCSAGDAVDTICIFSYMLGALDAGE